MNETPLHKRKWFYIVSWMTVLIVSYLVIAYYIDDFWDNPEYIILDVIFFVALLIFWLAFFSQFVLPVHTAPDRQKIFDRLITYIFGGHGPAIFIENGKIRERPGETEKKGPGVLWLDSASAAVTRTATAIKQRIGPGVHFIENKEFIAGKVDLHTQNHSIGPKEKDKPFEKQKEGQSDDEFNKIQDGRKQVSALTRDGIEVVPNISVTFRVDTDFKEGQSGSRFGFRTGITKKDKEYEEKDKEAVRKAVLGEGINPKILNREDPRHRVAWNQLPAIVAVDVWREYAAKFTLDELFKPEHSVPPAPPLPTTPEEPEIDPLSQPIYIGVRRGSLEGYFISTLRYLNVRMDRLIKWLDGKPEDKSTKTTASQTPAPAGSSAKKDSPPKTALQVINEMVKARLTQEMVHVLNEVGKPVNEPPRKSLEFELLKERGLRVTNVNISNPRFSPTVEDSIIRSWNASWLSNAKAESEQIDRRRNNTEKAAEEQAKRQYAESLSREINKLAVAGKTDIKETLKALILHSHSLIQSREPLRRRMTMEMQDIEQMIKWIEANGK